MDRKETREDSVYKPNAWFPWWPNGATDTSVHIITFVHDINVVIHDTKVDTEIKLNSIIFSNRWYQEIKVWICA